MTPTEVLAVCQERGVVFAAEAGRLRFRDPAGVMDEELRAEVKAHRRELIALLAPVPPATDLDGDLATDVNQPPPRYATPWPLPPDFPPPPDPSRWVGRLPGPDGESCQNCGQPINGSTCWVCMTRRCLDCGQPTAKVTTARCETCAPLSEETIMANTPSAPPAEDAAPTEPTTDELIAALAPPWPNPRVALRIGGPFTLLIPAAQWAASLRLAVEHGWRPTPTQRVRPPRVGERFQKADPLIADGVCRFPDSFFIGVYRLLPAALEGLADAWEQAGEAGRHTPRRDFRAASTDGRPVDLI